MEDEAPWKHLCATGVGRSVQIAVGPTADAAAACRMLHGLLSKFNIAFDTHPVLTTVELSNVLSKFHKTAYENAGYDEDETVEIEPKFQGIFVLLGCGARVDLGRMVKNWTSISAIHVIDSYRPFHLANLEYGEKVFLWCSNGTETVGEISRNLKREIHHFFKSGLREIRRQLGSEQYVWNDEEAIVDLEEQLTREAADIDLSEELSMSSESEASDTTESDPNDDMPINTETSHRIENFVGNTSEERTEMLEALYYSTAWKTRPVSCVLLEVTLAAGFTGWEPLWNASVGAADLFQRGVLDRGTYLSEFLFLKEAHQRMRAGRGDAVRLAEAQRVAAEHSSPSLAVTGETVAAAIRVEVGIDVILPLLGHSSLWDSLRADRYVASVLSLHRKEIGDRRLIDLISAHCGISVEDARKPWSEHSQKWRREKLALIEKQLRQLGLFGSNDSVPHSQLHSGVSGIQIGVLSRCEGYSQPVSPFDACHLYYATLTSIPVDESDGNLNETDQYSPQTITTAQIAVHQRTQFWKAMDILDMSPGSDAFDTALSDALAFSQACEEIVSELMADLSAGSTLTGDRVISLVRGRRAVYAELRFTPSHEMSLLSHFCHPLLLQSLADRLEPRVNDVAKLPESTHRKRRRSGSLSRDMNHITRRPVLICAPLLSGENVQVVCAIGQPFPALLTVDSVELDIYKLAIQFQADEKQFCLARSYEFDSADKGMAFLAHIFCGDFKPTDV